MSCLYCDRTARKLGMCDVHYTRLRRHGHPTNGPQAEEPRIVERDPCPRCAVRGDIGCRHKVAA